MSTNTEVLRARLAYRIRTASPEDWGQFANLWIAFNAIYGGEPDKRERSRVMTCIRRAFTEQSALRVLRAVTRSVDKILEIPPGNLRLDPYDPQFRAASRQYAALYRNKDKKAVTRLAAVGGILYQVRCNLLHGDKDPNRERDQMLVRESLAVLQALLPELEKNLGA